LLQLRPVFGQESVFSGHHRRHELKYQSVTLPVGIGFLFGPAEGKDSDHRTDITPLGRHHDQWLLRESGILQELEEELHDDECSYVIYGDPGYSRRPGLQCPVKLDKLTPAESGTCVTLPCYVLEFNRRMSSVRQSVEWKFGDVTSQFQGLELRRLEKCLLSPVAHWYKLAYFFTNCAACFRGSITTSYFQVLPPTIDDYLGMLSNAC